MVAVSSRLISRPPASPAAPPASGSGIRARDSRVTVTTGATPSGTATPRVDAAAASAPLPLLAAVLVVLPVFGQAPWVRSAPMAAALFTAVLLAAGILLERHSDRRLAALGPLLVGFSGSWLGGCLFWGWCRLHPLWHLPIEAFALPLAVAGLSGRWRLAGCFYLASLLGTAATDGAMAITGVIHLWPEVLQAPLNQAPPLLQAAALRVLQPLPLATVCAAAAVLLLISRQLWSLGGFARVAAATLATTLLVDGLFLAAALAAPALTGLL
ncbi:MAG: DUF3120 domain-containing protein [Cyanobium sp.]